VGQRGARRQGDRFLWAGVTFLLLSSGMGVYAAVGGDSMVLGVALAAFGFCAAVLLLLFRSHLVAAERAVEILAESVRSRGATETESRTPDPASGPPPQWLLERNPGAGSPEADTSVLMEDRLLQINSAHQDLLAHHRFTKRMLQSLRHEEVLEILLQGVREGLGFSGAILGVRDPEGNLSFRGGRSLNGGENVMVAGWDERSLVARTFWSGSSLLISALREHPHTEEDRHILGEGRSFLVSIYRKSTQKCSETMNCFNLACPVHDVEGARCWIEGKPERTVPDTPEAREERKRECTKCDMFAASGLIVVRERRDSRPLTRETTRAIVSLADEASLSLQMANLYENVRIMAVTDGLTGLTNHREFYVALRRELERARRYSHAVSLLMIDVDNFKEFNDRFGHMEGDQALRAIANILKRCVRASDIVARYGGEEFGIILPESTPIGAQMLAERIKTEIASHEFVEGTKEPIQLTVSIGIYTSKEGADSEDLMVGFADEASYIAKNSGKNKVVVKAHA